MIRTQGLAEITLNDDTLVKTGEGYVVSATVAWKGAAVGDAVYFRDGTDATGTVLVPFIFPTANGTIPREWLNGKKFATGLFVDVSPSGGSAVFVEITYK